MSMKACPRGYRPCTRCHGGKTNFHGLDHDRVREFRPPGSAKLRQQETTNRGQKGLTVRELRETIKDAPDDALVGVYDHFGDLVPFREPPRWWTNPSYSTNDPPTVFAFEQIDIGEEPG